MNDKDKSKLPFFRVKDEEKEEKIKWLVHTKDALMEESKNRVHIADHNLSLYLGKDTLDKSNLKTGVPVLYDIIENNVSQVSKLAPKVRVLPKNNEYGDKGAAKVAKAVIDDVYDKQNFQSKVLDYVRQSYIMGESYMQVNWDETLGEIHPKEQTLEKLEGKRDQGRIRKRVGDVAHRVLPLWRVLLQPKKEFEDVDYYFSYEIRSVEEIAEDYELTREEILKESPYKEYDEYGNTISSVAVINPEDMCKEMQEDHIPVYTFWHKRTKYCPMGAKIVMTDSMILDDVAYPFTTEKLNIVPLKDLSLPGVLHGRSRIQLVSHLQRIYNLFTRLEVKYVTNTARTKYFVPQGAIRRPEALGNNDAIVEFAGGVAPSLAQVPRISSDLLGLKNTIKNHMTTILGLHPISQGSAGRNIEARSTTSLQFLDNLEFEAASSRIRAYSDAVRDIAQLTLAIAGDFYKNDQNRLARIVGTNKKSLLKHFNASQLSTPYDVKLEGTDGFPESTAAKRARLVEILPMIQGQVPAERILQLLELGDMDKLLDITGAAIDSAESENEDFINTETVNPPESHEDHITHLRVHYAFIQTRDFKEYASNEIYKAVMTHIQAHELLALKKAEFSASYAAELSRLKNFPVTDAAMSISADIVKSQQQQQAIVNGQANRGEQVTEKIGDVEE